MKSVPAALAAFATAVLASAAHAAACDPFTTTAVEVDVREALLVVQRDLSTAELAAMAAQLGRPTAHPVLGLYAGTVGYALRQIETVTGPPTASGGTACPGLDIHAEFVAVDRRIVIASDLSSMPCRLRAAMEHYRRHAEAASLALQRFAAELPGALGPEVDRYVRSRPRPPQADDGDLRRYVDVLLDKSVVTFMASLGDVQDAVDSPEEIRRLIVPCGDT